MILLVDIGNTNIKTAKWINGDIVETRVCSQGSFANSLTLGFVDFEKVEQVVACNVSGMVAEEKMSAICQQYNVALRWITSTHPYSELQHCYSNPDELGNDRWVAMAGARHYYSGDLLVIDCGTATTIDLVDANGRHRGGAIIPGIATMRRALASNTSDLQDNLSDQPLQLFNKTTADAISGGTAFTLAGAIERFIEESRQLLGNNLTTILCGGEAQTVMPLLRQKCSIDTTLVFKGLVVTAGLQ